MNENSFELQVLGTWVTRIHSCSLAMGSPRCTAVTRLIGGPLSWCISSTKIFSKILSMAQTLVTVRSASPATHDQATLPTLAVIKSRLFSDRTRRAFRNRRMRKNCPFLSSQRLATKLPISPPDFARKFSSSNYGLFIDLYIGSAG